MKILVKRDEGEKERERDNLAGKQWVFAVK